MPNSRQLLYSLADSLQKAFVQAINTAAITDKLEVFFHFLELMGQQENIRLLLQDQLIFACRLGITVLDKVLVLCGTDEQRHAVCQGFLGYAVANHAVEQIQQLQIQSKYSKFIKMDEINSAGLNLADIAHQNYYIKRAALYQSFYDLTQATSLTISPEISKESRRVILERNIKIVKLENFEMASLTPNVFEKHLKENFQKVIELLPSSLQKQPKKEEKADSQTPKMFSEIILPPDEFCQHHLLRLFNLLSGELANGRINVDDYILYADIIKQNFTQAQIVASIKQFIHKNFKLENVRSFLAVAKRFDCLEEIEKAFEEDGISLKAAESKSDINQRNASAGSALTARDAPHTSRGAGSGAGATVDTRVDAAPGRRFEPF